jgi:hypothetical protein
MVYEENENLSPEMSYLEHCVCESIQKEMIKEIIQELIAEGKLTHFTKNDIEIAIMKVRGVDKRTFLTWFSVLWKLQYLTQSTPGIYELNLNSIQKLDVEIAFIPKTDSGSHE